MGKKKKGLDLSDGVYTLGDNTYRLGCVDHPKYRALRRPVVDCVECLKMYVDKLEEELDYLKSLNYTENDD